MFSESLTEFERKILRYCLRGDEPWAKGLISQIDYVKVEKRDFFADGFKVYFGTQSAIPGIEVERSNNLTPPKGWPPSVFAQRTIPTTGRVAFNVWLDANGRLSRLEGSLLDDDKWPRPPFDGFEDFQDETGKLLKD